MTSGEIIPGTDIDREELSRKMRRWVGIERGMDHMTFTNYDIKRLEGAPRAKVAAYKFAHGRDLQETLIIQGPTGIGKTHLAASVLRYRLRHWLDQQIAFYTAKDFLNQLQYLLPSSRFQQVPALKAQLKQYWGTQQGEAETAKIIRRLCIAPFLVLDDLGREHKAPSFCEVVDQIAEERTRRALPTIITTNHKSDWLKERYGAPVYSRLVLPATIISLNGQDQRKKAGARGKE